MRLFEIESNYSKALSSNVSLYRGMNSDMPELVKQIRTDRTALHSSPLYVFAFDTLMETVGFPHRKSNTVSFSNWKSTAADYGNVYQVYASNDAQYLYSKDVVDFISVSLQLRRNFDGIKTDKMHKQNWPRFAEYIQKYGPDYLQEKEFFITTDVNEVADAADEVLVYGSSFMARAAFGELGDD